MKTLPIAAAGAVGTTAAHAGVSPSIKEIGHKLKISLNVFSFNKQILDGKTDLFEVLKFCAKYNFDAIDPTGYYFPGYPEVPTDAYINRFKREAFMLGLDISGTGVRNDFANPDKSVRREEMKMIKQWIIAASKLGIPNLRVFPGKHKHEGYTRDQVFEWMAVDLKECCAFGADHGVMIAVQNHNDFLKTADDVDRLFQMVDSEWLGLNLDIGSYRQSDPYKEIKQNISKAVTWQIKERVYVNGEPEPTDYVKLMRIIKASGYRGYLPLETLQVDPWVQVPVLLKQVRDALKQVG